MALLKKVLLLSIVCAVVGCQSIPSKVDSHCINLKSCVLGLHSKIHNNWRPPKWEKPLTAKVMVELDQSGSVVGSSISESSGVTLFDKTLVDAVFASSPFREINFLPRQDREKLNKFTLLFSKEASEIMPERPLSTSIIDPKRSRSAESMNYLIEGHFGRIYNIYKQALIGSPGLRGTIIFDFEVKPDGTVIKCSSSLLDEPLSDLSKQLCEYMESIDFGKGETEDIVHFSFPISFLDTL